MGLCFSSGFITFHIVFFGLNLQTFDYFLLIKQMECQAGVCVGLGRGRVGGEGVGGQTFIDDTVGNFFYI